jgi:PKD repeat protein
MSAAVVPAGQNVSLVINGSGFVNLVNAGGMSLTLSSKVLLTSATGATTLLTPSSIDAANIVVTIPANMAIGAYKLNVVKVSATDAVLGTSGPQSLVVVGPVTITSATASNNVLTVIGSGFGAQPTFDGRAIDAVSVNGVACKVSSWTDTQITAACTAVKNGDPVVVTTLLNGASATATVAATNQSPVAVATATPSSTSTRRNITFDGTKSYDPDGTIVKWAWNFGNGSTKTGSKVTYSYSRTGTYTVTLTVTDNKGATGSATVKVTIR